MQTRKFFGSRKGSMEDMPISEGILGPILALLVIIAVSLFLLYLWNWYNSSQEDQASINNFEELHRRLEGLKDDEETLHPIFLQNEKYIVGFEADKDLVSGKCRLLYQGSEIGNIVDRAIQKPKTSCGNSACICLCDGTDCSVAYCKQTTMSLVGGVLEKDQENKDDEICDFVFISGLGSVRNIYLKREGDFVKICSSECT